MTKSRWFIGIALLSIISLFFLSCSGHLEGFNSPRQLTDDEKGKVIEVALATPEVQKQLESKAHYNTEVNWLAITWSGSKWSAYYHIDSEWETDPNLKNVPDSAFFFPYVGINFMEPASWQVAIAVDLDKGKVVLVHEYPAGKGSIHSGSDEFDIRPAPIYEVDIRIAESYPPQVFIYIKGGLSDRCTTFHELTRERSGNTIIINVTTKHPKDTICPAVYGYFEKNVNLGSDFISGQKYTI